jgi:hypothetical protein
MANNAHLVPVKDRDGKFTGDYKCSLCDDTVFRPYPGKQSVLNEEFNAHKRLSHPPQKSEDVNQAAARIVREATDKD